MVSPASDGSGRELDRRGQPGRQRPSPATGRHIRWCTTRFAIRIPLASDEHHAGLHPTTQPRSCAKYRSATSDITTGRLGKPARRLSVSGRRPYEFQLAACLP